MNQFTNFISKYGNHTQVFLFASLFFVAWNIENITGLVFNYNKWNHLKLNSFFILTSIPGQFIMGIFFAKTIQWTILHQFGLLYKLHFSISWLVFITTFILLDFGEYIYHVIMHKIKRLWMIHAVHHSDKVVDTSTTLREHPIETIIRLTFTLLWVFLSGAAFWAFMLRQIIQVFTTLFAHINYQLPKKIDNVIGLIFITPNLHQVHHHYKQPYTDCNYGDVLSIWDRIFGTFKKLPASEIIFGVDVYMKSEDIGSFKSVFKIPFGKYRSSKDL